jgi:hypothetical protein
VISDHYHTAVADVSRVALAGLLQHRQGHEPVCDRVYLVLQDRVGWSGTVVIGFCLPVVAYCSWFFILFSINRCAAVRQAVAQRVSAIDASVLVAIGL